MARREKSGYLFPWFLLYQTGSASPVRWPQSTSLQLSLGSGSCFFSCPFRMGSLNGFLLYASHRVHYHPSPLQGYWLVRVPFVSCQHIDFSVIVRVSRDCQPPCPYPSSQHHTFHILRSTYLVRFSSFGRSCICFLRIGAHGT